MASRVNLKYQSKNVTGEKVDFEIEKEDWSIYKLDDGTRLKMRTIVGDIIRLVDEYNAQGDPIYLVQSQNMVSADVPDHLKKDLHGSDEVH